MNYCRCGCGTPVAQGRQWVRGHNMRVMSVPADPVANPDQPPYDPGPGETWQQQDGQDQGEQQQWWNDPAESRPWSYDEAAGTVPDDPDPARMPPGAAPSEDIPVTDKVRRDIAGKLAFWGSLGIDLWNMVDPYCAGVAADNVDKIARKATPLVCQSPDLVRWLSKSSTFIMWTELGMATKPVIAAVIAHHVTKKVQTRRAPDGEQQTREADWSAYTAA
jgi:hypothetical protein